MRHAGVYKKIILMQCPRYLQKERWAAAEVDDTLRVI